MSVCVLFLLLNLPRPLCAWYIGRSNTHTTTFSPLNCIILGIYLPIWCLLSLQTIWTRCHPVGFVQCLPPIKCKVKYFAHLRPRWVRQNSPQSHISSLQLKKQNKGGRESCEKVGWHVVSTHQLGRCSTEKYWKLQKKHQHLFSFTALFRPFHHIFLNHGIISAASDRSHLCTHPDRPMLSLISKLNTEWLHSPR